MLPALLVPVAALVVALSPGLPAGSAAGGQASGVTARTASAQVAPGPTTRAGVLALAHTAAAVGVAAAAGAVPSASPVGPRGQWVWPLRPQPAVVRGFEPPPRPWAGGHRGVDLAGGLGQEVRAAGDGVVGFSGVVAGRGVVSVRHAGGWRTTYEPVEDRLPEGTVVVAGERIGRLAGGPANHCSPRVCLHWGAMSGPGSYHDPLVLLGLSHPVLLPLGEG